MAVRVYDRASDSMCPRFFGIFRSSCFVSIRYNPHRRWQSNQVEGKDCLHLIIALARGQGGTVTRVGGNTALRYLRDFDLKAPAVGYGPRRTIHFGRTDWHRCQWQRRRGLPCAGHRLATRPQDKERLVERPPDAGDEIRGLRRHRLICAAPGVRCRWPDDPYPEGCINLAMIITAREKCARSAPAVALASTEAACARGFG
jgi:hypothetical protein